MNNIWKGFSSLCFLAGKHSWTGTGISQLWNLKHRSLHLCSGCEYCKAPRTTDLWWNVEFLACVISRDSAKASSLSGLLRGCGLTRPIASTLVAVLPHMKAEHLWSGRASKCFEDNGVSSRGWLPARMHELNVWFCLSCFCCTVAARCSDRRQIWLIDSSERDEVVPAGAFLRALFSWNCEYTNQQPQMENSEHISAFFLFLLKLSSSESDSQSSDSSSWSDSSEVRIQSCLSYINSFPKNDAISFSPPGQSGNPDPNQNLLLLLQKLLPYLLTTPPPPPPPMTPAPSTSAATTVNPAATTPPTTEARGDNG